MNEREIIKGRLKDFEDGNTTKDYNCLCGYGGRFGKILLMTDLDYESNIYTDNPNGEHKFFCVCPNCFSVKYIPDENIS